MEVPFNTSRWFAFDTIDPHIVALVEEQGRLCGVIEEAKLYELPDKRGWGLVLPQSFWRYGDATTYRCAVWQAMEMDYGLQSAKRTEDVLLIWTHSSAYGFGTNMHLRVFNSERAAYTDCALLWNWICHVLSLPVAEQRKAEVIEEYEKWILKSQEVVLPRVPMNR